MPSSARRAELDRVGIVGIRRRGLCGVDGWGGRWSLYLFLILLVASVGVEQLGCCRRDRWVGRRNRYN